MNRWAIFERPCGTWNRDTLKHGQSPEDYPQAVAPRLLHRLGDLRLPEHLPARIASVKPYLSVTAWNTPRQHSAKAARNFSSGTLPSLAARMAANAGANTPLVRRCEATVEIEDDRFGHWPLALDFEKLVP